MRHFIGLEQLSKNDIYDIFKLADELAAGGRRGSMSGKSTVMFFPSSSLRTRVTFERGVCLLGSAAAFPARDP